MAWMLDVSPKRFMSPENVVGSAISPPNVPRRNAGESALLLVNEPPDTEKATLVEALAKKTDPSQAVFAVTTVLTSDTLDVSRAAMMPSSAWLLSIKDDVIMNVPRPHNAPPLAVARLLRNTQLKQLNTEVASLAETAPPLPPSLSSITESYMFSTPDLNTYTAPASVVPVFPTKCALYTLTTASSDTVSAPPRFPWLLINTGSHTSATALFTKARPPPPVADDTESYI